MLESMEVKIQWLRSDCVVWVGTDDPRQTPAAVNLDVERAKAWIKTGAQPTDTVRDLLKKAGL